MNVGDYVPLTLANEDYNAWRNTLISIISKHGYSTSNIPNWSGTTVIIGDAMLSEQIQELKDDIINTSQTICHVPSISSLDIGDYSVNKPTLLVTKTKIETKLAEMLAVCHHYTNYVGNNSDYNNYRTNYSDDSDDENYTDDDELHGSVYSTHSIESEQIYIVD